MHGRPSASLAASVGVAIGIALSGCAANPCRPHYFYTVEGAVRMPPDQIACTRHLQAKQQAEASLQAEAR